MSVELMSQTRKPIMPIGYTSEASARHSIIWGFGLSVSEFVSRNSYSLQSSLPAQHHHIFLAHRTHRGEERREEKRREEEVFQGLDVLQGLTEIGPCEVLPLLWGDSRDVDSLQRGCRDVESRDAAAMRVHNSDGVPGQIGLVGGSLLEPAFHGSTYLSALWVLYQLSGF